MAAAAVCNPRTRSYLRPHKVLLSPLSHLFSTTVLLLFCFVPFDAGAISFNYTGFDQDSVSLSCSPERQSICLYNDTFFDKVIKLTKNEIGVSIASSVGRAVYSQPVLLWDSATGRLTDFTTHFSFVINAFNSSTYGDGLAFFLSPYPSSEIPINSTGGMLGLFSPSSAFNESENSIVAVEFDSYQNSWDPSSDHVGINVNSLRSEANVTWKNGIKGGATANAWVSYDAATHNLSVFLTYKDKPVFNGSSLHHIVDLRKVLPERVAIGFSASTGTSVEIHNILSWSFSSNLEVKKKNNKVGLVVGLVVGAAVVLMGGFGLLLWFFLWKRRGVRRGMRREEDMDFDVYSIDDDEFEKGRGPKRFPYHELASATKNFAEEGKLGEGGFGAVYRGLLSDQKLEVAIKRVSPGSRQGRKEYISEVKIISRLRHRNLVQLIGWCHDRGELLLVYEFLPNGSLDSHLFRGERSLSWPARYKIAQGLASALLYLHGEWEQCVVHRDVKSSNVMLDSSFNAKLGDFGLARLVDHDRASQTTVLAGTMGYLAPECVTTGKASKESDVYSFGVVALEIACGRRPVEPVAEEGKVRLVEWVWDLYGRRTILEAADWRLCMEFEEAEIERLMVVGLWCAHPDYILRPSMRQAISVLNLEAPLPNLPAKMPVAMYFAPPMHNLQFNYTSKSAAGASSSATTTTDASSGTSGITNSSISNISDGSSSSPSASLLLHSQNI